MASLDRIVLFPAFEKFLDDTGLRLGATGGLAAKLPRILGQGNTKAIGLDLPPADIERMAEIAGLSLPAGIEIPEAVRVEIDKARMHVETEQRALSTDEGLRRFIAQVMKGLPEPKDKKDNRYFSEGLVLNKDHRKPVFSWGITVYHPVISNIPADVGYVIHAHEQAQLSLKQLEQATDRFENQFTLSWHMARHFCDSGDVPVSDVARLYKIARQADKFWKNPERRNFSDIPDAAFVVGLKAWQKGGGPAKAGFEFVPATLAQESKAFYLPINEEGTLAKPFIFIRKCK